MEQKYRSEAKTYCLTRCRPKEKNQPGHWLIMMPALVLLVAMLGGCNNNVRVDASPAGPGMFSDTFVLSEPGCRAVTGGGPGLPIDQYHAGQCYEKGIAVPVSMEKAFQHYTMAARWGIPEAQEALRKFGQPVPEADMQKRQQGLERQLQMQRDEAALQKLRQEQLNQMREFRHDYYYPYHYPYNYPYHYPHRCRRGWCD